MGHVRQLPKPKKLPVVTTIDTDAATDEEMLQFFRFIVGCERVRDLFAKANARRVAAEEWEEEKEERMHELHCQSWLIEPV